VLSAVLPDLAGEVRRDLENERDPLARRRGLISLAASIALEAHPADEVLALVQNDRGLCAAAAAGVRRAAELEPNACRPILEEVARGGGPDAIDALIDVQLGIGGDALANALTIARGRVTEMLAAKTEDAGRIAWLEALARDLSPRVGAPTLRERVRAALTTFATRGVSPAYDEASAIAAGVAERLEFLDAVDDARADGRRRAFQLVRELDQGVLDSACSATCSPCGFARRKRTSTSASTAGSIASRTGSAHARSRAPRISSRTRRFERRSSGRSFTSPISTAATVPMRPIAHAAGG
jgi:hypothetical protein